MLQDDNAHNRRTGIALISLATLLFATLDASAKALVLALPVFQVVFLRFAAHVVISAAVLAPFYGREMFRVNSWRLQGLRAATLGVITAMNFFALQYLQLAETAAIQFSVPLLIALISALFLGERIGPRRWLAIAVGFAGIVLIVRPGTQGFHPAILLSILNAIGYALFNLLTRHMAGSENPAATQWISALGAAILFAPLAAWQWQTPASWQQWALVACAGFCGGMGHYLVAKAHRYATAATLGPFLYQQIVYMTAWGFVAFGQVPGPLVVAGAAVVVASGLYLLWLEVKRR